MNLYDKLKDEYRTKLDNSDSSLKDMTIRSLKDNRFECDIPFATVCNLWNIISKPYYIGQYEVYELFED